MIPSRLLLELTIFSLSLLASLFHGAPSVKSEDAPKSVLVVAHRGGSALGPENTLEAAQAGFESGADSWELDTQLTKDGVPVLLHDDSLKRTTNAPVVFPGRKPWRLSDFTLEEVKKLDAGSWWVKQAGEKSAQESAVSRERLELYSSGRVKVPTLEEALLFTKKLCWRVNVEIKAPAPGTLGPLVPRVLDVIRKTGMVERVVISCFDHAVCRAVASSPAPRPRVQVLTGSRLALPHVYVKDVVGAEDFNPAFDSLGLGGKDEAAGEPDPAVVVKRLREAGVGVNVWTLNEPEAWKAALALGVTAIITDRPGELRRWLAGN